jgi:succinate dehydrogenase/fumarate reductase flavoprotein subunit
VVSPSETPHEHGIAADILVIGVGGGGLHAAIEAKERGMSVMIVSKRRKADAHTSLAVEGLEFREPQNPAFEPQPSTLDPDLMPWSR